MEIQTHRNCDIRGSMCSALKRPLQCAVQFLYLRICVSPQRPAIDPSNPERGFIQQNARLATAPSHWKIWNCTLRYCGMPKNVSPHHGGGGPGIRNPDQYIIVQTTFSRVSERLLSCPVFSNAFVLWAQVWLALHRNIQNGPNFMLHKWAWNIKEYCFNFFSTELKRLLCRIDAEDCHFVGRIFPG